MATCFLLTPLYYQDAAVGLHLSETIHLSTNLGFGLGPQEIDLVIPITISSWVADSLLDALAFSALGLCLLLGSFHVTNAAGKLLGAYARTMLR